jgi:hypothetical protein
MIMRRWGHSPRFSLPRIRELVAAGEYHVTDTARRDADALTFDEDDIVECIGTLTGDDYSHTLTSEKRPGALHDVYRKRLHGFPLYIKLQLTEPDWAVIISFKRDSSV